MMSRLQYLNHKIVDKELALKKINVWKMKADKIVFTNGCFDILHVGHVSYLAQAASCGNRLVVAINTDSSLKSLGKGANRPVNNEDARTEVVAALGFVDLVVLFDDSTPIELVSLFKPDVLTKGADYDPDEEDKSSPKYIVGANEVKSSGGDVISIPLVEGFSTTGIIEKLKI